MRLIDEELMNACQYGNARKIVELLQEGADVNCQDFFSRTPLVFAVRNGHCNIIDLLVEHGADPLSLSYKRWTLLHHACECRQYEAARHLIERYKIDPNACDSLHRTALSIAVLLGDRKMIDLLVDHGADPHYIDFWGENIVFHAVVNDDYDTLLHILTRYRVTPNCSSRDGEKPILIAAKNGNNDIIDLLVEHGANIEACDQNGLDLLQIAVENRQIHTVRHLLDRYHFPHSNPNQYGAIAVQIAAWKGDTEAIELLIAKGADITHCDRTGQDALFYACLGGHANVVKYLILCFGLNPNRTNKWGETPFLVAAKCGHHHLFNPLITLGANPFHFDHEGWNALHHAISMGHVKAFRRLIVCHDFDPNMPTMKGEMPLQIAMTTNRCPVIDALRRSGAVILKCDRSCNDKQGGESGVGYAEGTMKMIVGGSGIRL